jgi:predicted Co/Zn/Cd cation transporter (cation efflux family)
MRPRPFLVSLVLLFVTIVAGLVVRMVPLDLDPLIVKYGGSMLWALAIYWLVSTILSRSSLVASAMFAGLIATAIEFLKLYQTPDLEAFRYTLPGTLLLGQVFSFLDIAAYWIAVLFGAVIDIQFRPAKSKFRQPAPGS